MSYTDWQHRILQLEDGSSVSQWISFYDGTRDEFEADEAKDEILKNAPVNGLLICKDDALSVSNGLKQVKYIDGVVPETQEEINALFEGCDNEVIAYFSDKVVENPTPEPEPDPEPEMTPDYSESEVPLTEHVKLLVPNGTITGSNGYRKTFTSIENNILFADYYTSSTMFNSRCVLADNYTDGFNLFIKMYNNVSDALDFYGYDDALPESVISIAELEKYKLGNNLIKSASTYADEDRLVYQLISKREHFVISGNSSFELLHIALKKTMFGKQITDSIVENIVAACCRKKLVFMDIDQFKNLTYCSYSALYSSGDKQAFTGRNDWNSSIDMQLSAVAKNRARFFFFTNTSAQYIASNLNSCDAIFFSVDPSK